MNSYSMWFLKPIFWIMDAGTVEDFSKQNDYARENTLRKWNSVCFSLDFGLENQTCQMSLNGQVTDVKYSSNSLDWGWNYGFEKPGMNFTLGKYFSGAPFIGKVVEFNAWNRTLTAKELERYSDCKTYFKVCIFSIICSFCQT